MIEKLNIPNVDAVELRKQRDALLDIALISATQEWDSWSEFRVDTLLAIEQSTGMTFDKIKKILETQGE